MSTLSLSPSNPSTPESVPNTPDAGSDGGGARVDRAIRLYRHATKEEWGLGILAWEGPRRRRYQFQDGVMRTIGKGHYDKMVLVESPPDNARALIADLTMGRDAALARRRLSKIDPSLVKDVITFEGQVEFFQEEYPNGFQGDRWLEKMRGVGVKRALKRHRDPVIAKAGALLDVQVLDKVVAEGRAAEHVEALIQLLGKTDLVRAKGEISTLADMNAQERHALLVSLRELLGGTRPVAHCFDSLIGVLTPAGGSLPSWPLATILPALAMPKRYAPVRGMLFRRQSHWVAPELEHRNTPSGALYVKYLDMVQMIERSLLRREFTPHDMFDVYDFMSLTLKSGAAKKTAAAVEPQAVAVAAVVVPS